MKIYNNNVVPVRTKPDQYSTFYGLVIGSDLEKGALIVRHRDTNDKKEYIVVPKSDKNGTWWEVVA